MTKKNICILIALLLVSSIGMAQNPSVEYTSKDKNLKLRGVAELGFLAVLKHQVQFSNSGTGGSCDTGATNAVYYTYTPATTGTYTITATNADTSTNPWSRLAVFETAACSPYGNEVLCETAMSNAITSSSMTLVAGTTYMIMFYTDGSSYIMVDPTIDIQ